MELDKTIFSGSKIAVVTNRAPVSPVTKSNATIIQRSIGGLVAALEPLMGQFDGKWFCTVSKSSQLAKESLRGLPYKVTCLELTENELEQYYEGYSNKQLWPLFHYFPDKCIFNDNDWNIYKSVNEKMAEFILKNVSEDYYIWVHDYHFLLLPKILRSKNPKLKIGFFLHVPFPNQDIFRLLANSKELVEGLLGADLIGFHTNGYAEHFINTAMILKPEVDKRSNKDVLIYEGRKILVGSFPISVDFEYITKRASSEKIVKKVGKLEAAYGTDYIGISVDRLDYSKGIIERLNAIEQFFEDNPSYLKKVIFIQLLVPSRTKVETYQELKRNIDETIGRINGKFSKNGWRPIFYVYSSMEFDELLAHYILSDFALVVPLRDGMNLVAKEYVASKVNNQGVLVLSEFAGASEELKDAILVNPYHRKLVAGAIKSAIEMQNEEKTLRMRRLREKVKANDVYNWINEYFSKFNEIVQENKKAIRVS